MKSSFVQAETGSVSRKFRLSAVAALVLVALGTYAAIPATAAESVDSSENVADSESDSSKKTEEIVVRDTLDKNLTSYQYISRIDIDRRPTADGNITDLLKSNPAVQFSNSSANSLTMGEIKPADISIHGSLAYQNNFLLDGTSINSDLDPARNESNTIARLGGTDEQGFYIDARLLEGIAVYDRNIPAEFSGFTGGVVDAQTRSWTGENHINVFVRGSEGSWGSMIIDPQFRSGDFKNDPSHPAQYQTDFKKRTYGFSGEWGLNENLGFVIGYTRRESEIPIEDFGSAHMSIGSDEWGEPVLTIDPVTGQMRNQKRISDNFFSKGTLYISDRTSADLSFNYSGSKAKMFLPGMADSDYTDRHDGYNITANFNHAFDAAKWTTTLAYSYMYDKRDADSNTYITYMGMDDDYNYFDYAAGSYGDLEQNQQVFTGKTKLEFAPIQTGEKTFHQFTVGADMSITRSEYERTSDINQYQIQNMGWMMATTTRWVKGKYDADLNQFGIFGEHLLQVDRVTFRTGVRFDYDDFTEDVNFAPRFTANWDVFGDGATVLNVGANRYFGRNMLAYVLAEGQQNGLRTAYEYVAPGEEPEYGWEESVGYKGLDDLKTPHADEFTVGVTQRINNLIGSLAYVHRNVRDEIRGHQSQDGIRTFLNDGRTTSDSIILSINNATPWKFAKADNYIRFSFTWEDTTSNVPLHLGYTENNTTQNFDTSKVYYDGKLIDADDLDATDFNIPLKFNIETTHHWVPWGLTWYNLFKWNGSRDQAQLDSGNYYRPDGVNGPAYAMYNKNHFSSTWTWDTKLQYKPDWAKGVGVSLEVNNVTNQKNVMDYADYTNSSFQTVRYRIYEPGRQFWLQLSYDY